MVERRANSGFSLIEVMIAVLVLAIGLVGILGVQTMGIRTLAHAKNRTAASQLAATVMEKLKNTPADPANTSRIFNDSSGHQIVDANGGAPLSDVTIEDGKLSWHTYGLMDAQGNVVSGCTGDPRYSYLVIYGVEWAVNKQSVKSAPATWPSDATPYTKAQYATILPLQNEIYIQVWVGWAEPGDAQLRSSGIAHETACDYVSRVDNSFPTNPAIFPLKRVIINDIRSITPRFE